MITQSIQDAAPFELERRRVTRKLLNLHVELLHQGATFEHCTATDIGLGGMFVRCNPASVQLQDIIEPEFWLDFGEMNRRCRIIAHVVRLSEYGIGIAFHRHDGPHFRYVQKIMYEQPRNS